VWAASSASPVTGRASTGAMIPREAPLTVGLVWDAVYPCSNESSGYGCGDEKLKTDRHGSTIYRAFCYLIVRSKKFISYRTRFGFQSRSWLGFDGFSVGEKKTCFGQVSMRKTSLVWAGAGHWATCDPEEMLGWAARKKRRNRLGHCCGKKVGPKEN
jgi:hypothetical protein